MKTKRALLLLMALAPLGAVAQSSTPGSDASQRIFLGDKQQPNVKYDPANPVASIHQTAVIKAAKGDINLLCLGYIGDFKNLDYRWEIWDQNKKTVDMFVIQPKAGSKWSFAEFALRKAGKFTVAFLNTNDMTKPIATLPITVTDSTAATAAATATAPSVLGGNPDVSLTVCSSVDDSWKPVGAATTWKVNVPFNVLIVDKKPFNLDFLGIDIFRQGPDGKDSNFISEYQQQVSPPTSRKYATVDGLTTLQQGKYSVYVIDWRKRELGEHDGNFKEYLAKVTLTVQ